MLSSHRGGCLLQVSHHEFSFDLPATMRRVEALSMVAYLEHGDTELQAAMFVKQHSSRPRLSLVVDGGPCEDRASFRALCDTAATATAMASPRGLAEASQWRNDALSHLDEVFTWSFANDRGTVQVVTKIRVEDRWLSLSGASDFYSSEALKERIFQVLRTVERRTTP